MRNTYSKGSEYQHLVGAPCNEDHGLLVEVTAATRDIVTAKKVWDEGNRVFYAKNCLNFVPDVGSFVLFRRAGEFASPGNAGYELRTQDASKSSWACIAPRHVCLVQDMGSDEFGRKGRECYYDSNKQLVVINANERTLMRPADPLGRYHANTPPWAQGRVYAAVRENGYYQAILPGHGDAEKTLSCDFGLSTLSINVDTQGNVVDFSGAVNGVETNDLWLFKYSDETWIQGTQSGDIPPATYGHLCWLNSGMSKIFLLSVDGFYEGTRGATSIAWIKKTDPPFTYARYASMGTKDTAPVGYYFSFGTEFWRLIGYTWAQMASSSASHLHGSLFWTYWPGATDYRSVANTPSSPDEEYNVVTDAWIPVTIPWKDSVRPGSPLYSKGSIGYLTGGGTPTQFLRYCYDGGIGKRYWYPFPSLATGLTRHSFIFGAGGHVYLFGGLNGGTRQDKTYKGTYPTFAWSDVSKVIRPPALTDPSFSPFNTTYAMLWGGVANP